MLSILVVTGSARPNSVNEHIVPLVVAEVEKQGAGAKVANLKELNLPFFDAPYSPSNPAFEPTHDSVKQWTQLVADADGVVFVTPEYNHTLTPIQSNAIDWIGKEWISKPVALVGYGFTTGGGQAHQAAREALEATLHAKVGTVQTNLFLKKHIDTDGSLLEPEYVRDTIAATISDLVAMI